MCVCVEGVVSLDDNIYASPPWVEHSNEELACCYVRLNRIALPMNWAFR